MSTTTEIHRPYALLAHGIALVAVVALAVLPASAQDDDAEPQRMSRTYDLAELGESAPNAMRPEMPSAGAFTVWISRWGASVESWYDAEEPDSLDVSELVDVIYGVVGEADPDAELLDPGSGRIVVRTTNEGHRRAAAAVEIVRRVASEPMVVEVEELLLPADVPFTAAPDAATLDAWRAADQRGAPRAVGLSLVPGVWGTAADVQLVRGVVDVDVEIAQDAAIADPIVRGIASGLRVVARAQPATRGRVALTVLASAAEPRGEPRRVALGQDELGSVDLADLEAGFVSTEVLLTEDASRAILLARPGGARHVLVVRLVDGAPELPGGTLRFLPHGALSRPAMGARLSVHDDLRAEERPPFLAEPREDERSRLESDQLVELLGAEIESELDEGTAEMTELFSTLGGALAVRARSASLDRVAERLSALEDELLRYAPLSIRIEERLPGAARGRVIGALGGDVPVGVPVSLAAYRVAAIVGDQDVEVAEKSQISDPQIGAALAGLFANLVVNESGRGDAWSVALELRVMEFSEPRALPFAATDVGDVEKLQQRSLATGGRLRFAAAGSAELTLGRSPFSDRGARLVAVVSAGR